MSNVMSAEDMNTTCAAPDIFEVFTSHIMIANHAFILTIICSSFFLSYLAILKLTRQNVFPACTKILLISSIINGLIHQGTTAIIRGRVLHHFLFYHNDPCSILFASSSCMIEGLFYYYTNLFSSLVCVSLFLDRLLSFFAPYNSHQKKAAFVFILLQFAIPATLLIWVFYDANYTTYVPMCNCPPPGSREKFYIVTDIRLWFFYALFVASLTLFLVRKNREKKIVHKDYGVDSRYNSFESYQGTKAVLYVTIVQLVCLAGTSHIPTYFNKFRGSIPASWYHVTLAFATGLTYANFFVPIIIYYQTNMINESRRSKIQKLQIQPGQDQYFNNLQQGWDGLFKNFIAKNH